MSFGVKFYLVEIQAKFAVALLEYIGLGASLLFFIKTSRFDVAKVDELIHSITAIYQFNNNTIEFLQQHLLQQEHLILPFVESLETFEGCYDEI